MSGTTSIEWTDATLNPFTHRCRRVSEECDLCYAARLTARWHGQLAFTSGPPVLQPAKLLLPWMAPYTRAEKIFAVSMSDAFHSAIPLEDLALLFAMMAADRCHVYQLTTKRPGVMRSRLSRPDFEGMIRAALRTLAELALAGKRLTPLRQRIRADIEAARANWAWPLPNVWLGVSAGLQRTADLRIGQLLRTPAAVRWVSAEPLLGPVSLRPYLRPEGPASGAAARGRALAGLDWVVVGGESGSGARLMELDWARRVRDECAAAGPPVALFFKQLGTRQARALGSPGKGGSWGHLPDEFRIRQFPAMAAAA